MKITLLGNCQTRQLSDFLVVCLPEQDFEIRHFYNNPRTQEMEPDEVILAGIAESDLFIYQPLSPLHKRLSAEYLDAFPTMHCHKVKVPYVVNTGMYSLSLEPGKTSHRPYGYALGEETVRAAARCGLSKEEVIRRYLDGQLNFWLKERFTASLAEMRTRENETGTDIRLSDFILDTYTETQLFVSHSHPANPIFEETLRQLKELTELPLTEPRQPVPPMGRITTPISDYDVATHGFKFPADPDWREQGEGLLRKILEDEYTT